MEVLDCEEYIAGFCPNEEFYVDNVSIKCPYVHSTAQRSEYSRQRCIYPFDSKVLLNYKKIVDEINERVEQNQLLVSKEKLHGNLRKALEEVEAAINKEHPNKFDLKKLHQLLFIHGKLLEKADSLNKEIKIKICKNCSYFITDQSQKCTHPFCEKYQKLRKIVLDLELKLSTSTEIYKRKL